MNFIKTKKFTLVLFAILGLLVSAKLFHIYMQANFNPIALSSFCSINDIIDCDGIEKSMFSQVFGIPFACWGFFVYTIMIFLLFAEKLKNIKFLKFFEVFKNPEKYVAALGYITLTLSLILAVTAFINIKKICILCCVTYLIDLSLGLVGTDFKNGGILNVFKTSIDDFIDAVKIKKYGISFVICSLIFVSFLCYTTKSFVFVPQLKVPAEIRQYEKLVKNNPYKISGNILGSKNPKIKILLFTDYECPICRINNVMIHKAITEIKDIQIVHKNFPLDIKCNKNLAMPFHNNSCLYAKYSVAAEKQNKWGEMNDALFKNTPKNEDEILKLASDMNFDVEKLKKDAFSEETYNEIQNNIKEGMSYKVEGTPALVINGKLIGGMKPYKELKQILRDALKNEK